MSQKSLSFLLLADDAMLAEALLAQFPAGSGFVGRAVSLAEFESVTSLPVIYDDTGGPDLVLILEADTEVERLSKKLRRTFYHGPILHLTSQGDDSGDYDVLRLPVHYPALVQKMRSISASFWFRDDLALDLGGVILRPAFKELLGPGQTAIALTDKEVEVLIYLYRAGGKIISRDVLLAEVWGYNADVSTHTLETHIYRLRQKIETEGELTDLLVTELGGYRLNLRTGE